MGSYWKYRAYDGSRRVREGVLPSPLDEEQAPEQVMLVLRQQGLCGIELSLTDRAEYGRDQYLKKLKARTNPPTSKPTPPIRRRLLERIFSAIFGR